MNSEVLYALIALFSFGVVSLFFSILINGLLVKFSGNLGTRSNAENLIRWNTSAKPSFGGISFFIIFLLSVAALSFLFSGSPVFHNVRLVGIIVATTLAFMMGLFDDAYNTKVIIKLFAQITCGVILIATGTYISLFPYDLLNYTLTILWVVGMMNSINMLDNMDGITATVSLFIVTAILSQNLIAGSFADPVNLLLIGIVSAIAGFLVYNWPPSRMYMGDTGSQFLGLVLAALSIVYVWNHPEPDFNEIPAKQIAAVLVLFTLPIADTTTVTIKRLRRGKSPFVGGRDHTTHHLSYLGLTEKQVTGVFTILSALSAGLALICLNIEEWTHLYTALFCVYFLTIFAVLFYIANKNTN